MLIRSFSSVELLWMLEEMRMGNSKIDVPSYILLRCAQIVSVALGTRTQ